MNEDLKYRKAEPADAERIMEIIRQAKRYGSNEGEDDFHAGRIRRIKTFI